MNNEYSAYAPASIGNVSVGFDCLGLCLEAPGDTVRVREIAETGKLYIRSIEGDGGQLSYKISENVCGLVAAKVLEAADNRMGIEISIQKGLPLKSGMGSSAASSAAAALAVNTLLGNPFSKEELLPFVLEGEKLASGSAHADNAAPCLLGGIRLILPGEPVRTVSLNYPASLTVALVHPHISIATREARDLLPQSVSLHVAVEQASFLAAFVHALEYEEWSLIAGAMCDRLAEPVRSKMIPGFSEVKNAALEYGALSCGISGSGPALFALCRGKTAAENCAKAMAAVYKEQHIDCEYYVSGVHAGGAKILDPRVRRSPKR